MEYVSKLQVRLQSVPRSKHTLVSVIKTIRLMLYNEIIAVVLRPIHNTYMRVVVH